MITGRETQPLGTKVKGVRIPSGEPVAVAVAHIGDLMAANASDADLAWARLLLVDTLVCAAAAPVEDARRFRDLLGRSGHGPTAGVVDAPLTALLAHLEEYDPLLDGPAFTPGVIAASVLGAVGPGTTIDDVLRAVSVGVVAAASVGSVLDVGALYGSGFWPSSIVGAIGAAVAAGRLIGLTTDEVANAVSCLAAWAPSVIGPELTDAHYVSSAVAVEHVASAVRASAASVRGAVRILEAAPYRASAVSGDQVNLGLERFGLRMFKFHPCARPLHALIDATGELMAEHDLEPGDVLTIEAALPTPTRAFINQDPAPRTTAVRRTSAAYVGRLAVAGVASDPESYRHLRGISGPEFVGRFDDPEVDAAYPELWAARVRLTARDGAHEILVPPPGTVATTSDSLKSARRRLMDKWAGLVPSEEWIEALLEATGPDPFLSSMVPESLRRAAP